MARSLSKKFAIPIHLLYIATFDSVAADIDIQKLLIQNLAVTSVAKGIEDHNNICRKLPFTDKRGCVALRIANIQLRDAGVKYSDVKPSPIPETIATETFIFRNCSSNERVDRKNVAISFQEGYSITTSDSIRDTGGVSATLTIKGQQLGISESREVTFSKSQTQNFNKTVTENYTLEETIKPYTALVVNIERRISNAYLDFDGNLIADADLYRDSCCGWSGGDAYLGRYSDVVGEERVSVKGQIWNAKAQSTKKTYSESALDKANPVHCPPIAFEGKTLSVSEVTELSDLNKNISQPLLFNKASGLQALQVSGIDTSSVKQVVPFVPGMTITTADVVANVEVRAKSLAIGFCGVKFDTIGGSAQFLAPPNSWSPWTNLASHIGKANFTINNDISCDVGVIAEVRYFR